MIIIPYLNQICNFLLYFKLAYVKLEMEDYIFMDINEPKPNIKQDKKPGMGDKRASSDDSADSVGSTGKKLKPESMIDKVLDKISDAENVLVALSNDPSVDEIAAALGLTMALDSAGKHVTAIYSGKTPNVLQFLKPEEKFETGTDSLQDFVIALDKEKADHLRYKIDGDFVKVYVTPYKTTISGDDIEFSRGDYNVDLVISLNVPAATELDAALAEHGRIMHDATSINITNGAAGKFGDLEWVEPDASSISEMVAKLAFELEGRMDEATATALLTGLVAATDRFSNPATTPDAMVLAAKLMGAGADQQLVVQNVQGEVVFNGGGGAKSVVVPGNDVEEESEEPKKDPANLEISHDKEESEEKPEEVEASEEETKEPIETPQDEDAVKAAMAEAMGPAAEEEKPTGSSVAGVEVATEVANGDGSAGETVADQILNNIEKEGSNVGSADYGKMIDEALNEPVPGEGGIQVGAETANGPEVDTQSVENVAGSAGDATALNEMSAMGMNAGQQMASQAPQMPAVNEEEEAMNIIKQAQAEANAALPGMPANGELPKIITGGGMGINDTMTSGPMPGMGGGTPVAPNPTSANPMEANPAMMSAPAVGSEAAGVPEMNFGMQGAAGMPTVPIMSGMGAAPDMGAASDAGAMNPMPMPGQEMPPVPPMPDFGSMPPAAEMPSMPAMPSAPEMSTAPVENTIPVPEPVPMPDVTVQPDMNAGIAEMALPQVQEAPAAAVDTASSDPSAFKIPGIHT